MFQRNEYCVNIVANSLTHLFEIERRLFNKSAKTWDEGINFMISGFIITSN